MSYIYTIIKALSIIIFVLICIAFFTIAERKIIGSIQRRKGPNTIGFYGMGQAFADGLKLFLKEFIIPSSANKKLYLFAPILTFFLSLITWIFIPTDLTYVFSDINLGIIYILAISALGVYGIIIAGWSSNSKYAYLGSLRSTAQIISYEISIGFTLISVILCSNSFNLSNIVLGQTKIWYCFPLFPIILVFFISSLAETNRHPFDLPEAEAELVSGYNVEYSAMGFALFFLGEYSNIIMISTISVILFFGGWLYPFSIQGHSLCFAIKVIFFIIIFIWSRAAFPRYRYDQLIRLGWKVLLPFSISWIIFTASILYSFNWFI